MNQPSAPALPATDKPPKIHFVFNDPVFHTFLPNAPLMCVVGPERVWDEVKQRKTIIGIRCYWFNDKNERCSDLFESNVLRHPTLNECLERKLVWNKRWQLAA